MPATDKLSIYIPQKKLKERPVERLLKLVRSVTDCSS